MNTLPEPEWLCECGHRDADHSINGVSDSGDSCVEHFPCEVRGCQCPDYTQSDEETERWDNT